jgi:hypothetical protein
MSATSQVDSELAKLKAEVGSGDTAKQIEPGAPEPQQEEQEQPQQQSS